MKRALAAALLLVAGCKDEPSTKPAAPTPPQSQSLAHDAAPVARPPGDDGKPNEADRKDGEALLAAWLTAQNQGDFAAYQKLYGEKFTGVRRSGAKVRRFDRAGWMADRGRMFGKPMVVAESALSVIAHGAQTHLFFTQSFEQGSYKDAGRKWMALERTSAGMRIVREEMLDSTLLAKQSQELAVAGADDAVALEPGEVQLGWTGKRDKLYLAPVDGEQLLIGRASGSIGTGPVTVVDHTFDSATGSVAGVSATRAVDTAKLPKPLADRLGKTVQLLDRDLEPVCHAKIIGYSLRVIDWAPEKASDSPEQAATALFDESPVVVAALQLSGCPKGAEFARDVDLPKLPGTGDFELGDEEDMQSTVKKTYPEEPAGPDIAHVAGDRSHALAMSHAHTEDSCETQEEYQSNIFMMTHRGKRKWEALRLGSYNYEDQLTVGVDADRDGTIDVFTQRGVHRGMHSDFWEPDLRVFWPPGLGCDGCEGPDCDEEEGD
jgi:hypothetical protein